MIAARSGSAHRGIESGTETHSLRDMRPVTIQITREINTDSKPGDLEDGRDHDSSEVLEAQK